jgi:hypothetical protein
VKRSDWGIVVKRCDQGIVVKRCDQGIVVKRNDQEIVVKRNHQGIVVKRCDWGGQRLGARSRSHRECRDLLQKTCKPIAKAYTLFLCAYVKKKLMID